MSEPLLVAHEQALTDFMDDLLTEDTDDLSLEADGVSAAAGLPDKAKAATRPTDAQQAALLESAEAVRVGSVNPATVLASFSEDSRIPVLPDWGLQAFQAMVFKVGELSLAIPLTELAGVVEWQPAASAKGLCLGHYQHAEQSIRVVDIARLIYAGSQFEGLFKTEAHQRVTRVILMNNATCGLACDAVHEVITVQPTRVSWRSTRTRRQWLAGTLLDDMIVVLDAESTAKILTKMLADLE